MDKRATKKARGRLRVAQTALSALERSGNHQEFSDAWYTLLTAAKNVWTVLEQGSKVSVQSLQWYGEKRRERKGDGVQRYMFAARNDDEHGLAEVLEFHPGGIEGYATGNKESFPEGFTVHSMSVNPATLELALVGRDKDGKTHLHPLKKQWERKVTPHTKLTPVKAREGIIESPNNDPYDFLEPMPPLKAAYITIEYLEDLIAQAEGLHAP